MVFFKIANYMQFLCRFDNPAASAESPTREMTMHYLVALNGWLLCFPSDLCCDWTMGTVPLIHSYFDLRNATTLIFYGILIALMYRSLWEDDSGSRIVIMVLVKNKIFELLNNIYIFYLLF